jgi:alkyldihydroxyacetonephosphate synthase
MMRDEIGLEPAPARSGPPAAVTLPRSALADGHLLGRLRAACGIDAVRVDDETRLEHAGGRSYLDLLRLRSGDIRCAPDAVVLPADEAQIAAVLQACAGGDCAVVPFGGGTSVVGGVTALRGGHRAVIAISLRRLNRCVRVDPDGQTEVWSSSAGAR